MLGEAVSGGLICFANDDKKVGYLDATGKEVIPAQFDYTYTNTGKDSFSGTAGSFYDDGYAIVRMGEQFGIIDKNGEYVVNVQFDGIDTQTVHDFIYQEKDYDDDDYEWLYRYLLSNS